MSWDITVVVQQDEATGRGAFPKLGGLGVLTSAVVKSDIVQENLRTMLNSLDDVLANQPAEVAGFVLDEIEFNLGLNAQGGFELIGKITAGVQAGVKLKLKRKIAAPDTKGTP